jgi:hypothetical protein
MEAYKLQNSFFRRSLVCGIILLFIGASVTSSIGINIEKINKVPVEDFPANVPLNDNYVNAYWKFDEGSGNIAYDSSGNNYDGTINGATWTTGNSSYALDFDGIDDYITLDDYAQNFLGFNKTDDLIFSFYFRTTSTSLGIIYSISYTNDYNPGFQISLNSDGTLDFRIWRMNCGIHLISQGTYNDGDWHYAEMIYNGIVNEPTVEIYVDGELDISITYWVCAFYSDQFHKAKIGRHSINSTDYFDGKIDEFKIIKFPGGNKQNPPVISGPTIGNPGVKYDYTFITEDPEGDNIWLYIDWDDGTNSGWIGPYESGEEVVMSHNWAVDDRYVIKAKSKDYWHFSYSSDYVVKIGNQPPESPTISGPKYGDLQTQLTYTFVASDEEDEDVKYFIDWGDGTTDVTSYVHSNTSVQLSHSWDTKKDYNITAKAYDTHGKQGDPSVYHIRIGDQPPNMPKIYGASRCTKGIEYEYGFISVDPDNDNLLYDIDWGDGNIETDIGPFPSGEIFPRHHSWNKAGTYLIKVRVKDEFDYYSDWAVHKISTPRNKTVKYNQLVSLFEQFLLVFLKFKYPLGWLKYDFILLENL